MSKPSSFDVVSEVDLQEVDNAVNQAAKEIQQRYDLKDTKTILELNKKEKTISLETRDEYSRKQSVEILQSKMIKRGVSLKALKLQNPEPTSNGRVKQKINLENGISKDNAKRITKLIKDLKLKVTAQIMDEKIRVQGAKKDDLQLVIQEIKNADFDFAVQFVNYQ